MKSELLQTVWRYISGEAAGEIWNWSLLRVKGLKNRMDKQHKCKRFMSWSWSDISICKLYHVLWKQQNNEGTKSVQRARSVKTNTTLLGVLLESTGQMADSKFGPLLAELHLYLCNGTLSKADTSLNRTVALVPRVSALERVDCSLNVW